MTRPQADGEPTLAKVLDNHLRRVRLWVSTGMLVGGLIVAAGAFAANRLTGGLRAQVNALTQRFDQRMAQDSVRFERVMEIVDLVAIISTGPTTPEAELARGELLKRRKFTH